MLDTRFVLSLIFALLILIALLIGAVLWMGRHWSERHIAKSPYTGIPLRAAIELPYSSLSKVYGYLLSIGEYDNSMFAIRKAAYCRETGRIFPKTINWRGDIILERDFLQRRYPGDWLSWGSLSDLQMEAIAEYHPSLDKFQTEKSSRNPSPSQMEKEYGYLKPGPLYVDLETKVLLGWQCIPDTELEVLIVQKPVQAYTL